MNDSLVERVLHNLKERRQRVLNGGINCIPSPFKQFRHDFPGIEQGKYYLVTGGPKAAKTQLTSFLFLYTPLLYAYNNPDKVRVKIFYFPLEETPEKITMRFMCYLLYVLSNHKIRIDVAKLGSINKDNVLEPEILELLQSIEYKSILNFFEDHVQFIQERNPTGYYKNIKNYAEKSGTIHRKTIKTIDKDTGIEQEKQVFDYYEPNDPDEYVITIWDHAGNTDSEKNMDDREKIKKLSEYHMIARNHYNYCPVLIQQQNVESLGLEAFKANKIRPSFTGLADGKDPGRDASVVLGITNPFSFEIPRYPGNGGYDITQLKGYARFLEVILNREGESNGLLGLYFDGATNFFTPLPPSTDTVSLQKVYALVQKNIASNANNSNKSV